MAKYIVKHTSIMHSGKVYAEGSEIELTEKEAARLEDFVEFKQKTTTNKSNSSTPNKTQASKSSTKSTTTTDKTESTKDDETTDSESGANGDK